MKGKLNKILQSSFKHLLFHTTSNETNNLLGHYLAGFIEEGENREFHHIRLSKYYKIKEVDLN